MKEIVLCRCIFGGYDFCHDCGGSGVIIKHSDDYRARMFQVKREAKKQNLSLTEKIQRHIAFDNKCFQLAEKFVKKMPTYKYELILATLKSRIDEWRTHMNEIKRQDVLEKVKVHIDNLAKGIVSLEERAILEKDRKQKKAEKRAKAKATKLNKKSNKSKKSRS